MDPNGRTDFTEKKCSDLVRGDFVLDHTSPTNPLCEVLALSPQGDNMIEVSCRNVIDGINFLFEELATEMVTLPTITRKDYWLERIFNEQLILADDDKVINDRVRLPEGETGDELISLVNADIDVRVTVMKGWDKQGVESFKETVRERSDSE